MGFMLLQCGLGAFAPALLHIVAHSLYKAHAFMSSGSVIDLARAAWTPSPGGAPHPARVTLAAGLLVAIALVVGTLFGTTFAAQPAVVALGAIVLLGLVHLVVVAIDERPNAFVIGRAVGTAVVVAGVYFALQRATAALTAGSLPPAPPLHDAFDSVAIVLVVFGFAAITVFQNALPRHAGEPRWQALYAHLSNGLYVNTLANRLVIRLWPAPPPPPLTATTARAKGA
jgi:NAD(P)H-quinone oxidoreductase subunit 5